ncbi:MAG: DNA topoisomerase I [Methanoculleus sp. SDB]|nr:MAG: DNA topoisomerase I [Methanoculleus sp. SDB]
MHLIIAEKNIAAQRIAGILADREKVEIRKEGGVAAYRFGNQVAVGLRGHVVEIDFEPGYTNWRSEAHPPRTLIDAGMIKRPTEKRIVTLIQKLAKKADRVTIATDFDTEGELIGKEAYELVRDVNPSVPVQRARFSAITRGEITAAFSHPSAIDFDLAAAGEARQIVDLMWGASLTRFISIAARRGGKNILSVGRVQSPTLAMIVDREKEIEAFTPEAYWMLHLETEAAGQRFEARHTHGRFWDHDEAGHAAAKTLEPLLVTGVKEGIKTDRPPAPFDTTSFIVAAARLGFSAANSMRIAEDLYMNGHISYPRTDNTVYPASLDLDGILTVLEKSAFSRDAAWVRAHRRGTPTRGKKSSTDHPPIHPTGALARGQVSDDAWKIYELVVRRFLATLSPDATWKTLKYLFDASGQEYTATGQRMAEPGYLTVYTYSDAQEYILPVLVAGDRLPIRDVVLEEKATQPPPRYSQSRLIQRMEELGLGTKSTRHDVIGKLVSRRYVAGTPLRPTLVGRAVTESLESHVELITKPDMTRTLEGHMEEIKQAKRKRDIVVAESRSMLHQVFDDLEAHRDEIGEEIMERTDEERILGKCPVCGEELRLRQSKGMAQFIGCSAYPECGFNISLPSAQWGRAVRTEEICPHHGLAHVRLVRKGARPWDIGCPFCNHIASHSETLRLMPAMTDSLIHRLHSHHIYTVGEIAGAEAVKLASLLSIDPAAAARLIEEAESVLGLLRKRSELRKFLRAHIPPRRGRSHGKIASGLFAADVNTIRDLSLLDPAVLVSLKVGDKEAVSLIRAAERVCREQTLRETGIPPVSLKKYLDAGIERPEDFCHIPSAFISVKTGIGIETVQKHVEKVCTGMGVNPPQKITKKALEKGRIELLALPGVGEAILERLYRAGVTDAHTLAHAEPGRIARIASISEEKVAAMQKAAAGTEA